MVRVVKYRAEMALNVLEMARANNDADVIDACVRVRQGWFLGKRVAQTDLNLIAEFAEC